jgi:hypothetical protein
MCNRYAKYGESLILGDRITHTVAFFMGDIAGGSTNGERDTGRESGHGTGQQQQDDGAFFHDVGIVCANKQQDFSQAIFFAAGG